MEKKKETKRFDLMEFGSALGREEMKKLMAGSEGGCGGGSTCNCLICYTPGGIDEWCRDACDLDPKEECEIIYPAYDPKDVSGNWGICS